MACKWLVLLSVGHELALRVAEPKKLLGCNGVASSAAMATGQLPSASLSRSGSCGALQFWPQQGANVYVAPGATYIAQVMDYKVGKPETLVCKSKCFVARRCHEGSRVIGPRTTSALCVGCNRLCTVECASDYEELLAATGARPPQAPSGQASLPWSPFECFRILLGLASGC